MFAARVPQYESTTNVRIESAHVIAYFPPTAMGRISVGQPALVHVDGSHIFCPGSKRSPLTSVDLILSPNPQSPIPASSSASSDIETTRVSPAAIALRTLTHGNR